MLFRPDGESFWAVNAPVEEEDERFLHRPADCSEYLFGASEQSFVHLNAYRLRGFFNALFYSLKVV